MHDPTPSYLQLQATGLQRGCALACVSLHLSLLGQLLRFPGLRLRQLRARSLVVRLARPLVLRHLELEGLPQRLLLLPLLLQRSFVRRVLLLQRISPETHADEKRNELFEPVAGGLPEAGGA